jgi:adenosine/AMP kinase
MFLHLWRGHSSVCEVLSSTFYDPPSTFEIRRHTMELKSEKIEIPEGCNIIFGQTHFIKSVEDLYEIMVGSMPNAKFGIGFCEASGHCLVRGEGNDETLKDAAKKIVLRIGAGHTFLIVMKDAFPINVLNAVKMCQEVCTIFCATANPVEVILAQSDQGRGVLGVIDGSSPKGIENEEGMAWRKDLLRKFKYKL